MGKCFENENIFPIINRVIIEICQEKQAGTFTSAKSNPLSSTGMFKLPSYVSLVDSDPEYALHSEIIERLMQDRAAKTELADARRRCADKTEEWLLGNMVAWWSQTITQGNNFWGRRFDRKQYKNKWAYKPKSASKPA